MSNNVTASSWMKGSLYETQMVGTFKLDDATTRVYEVPVSTGLFGVALRAEVVRQVLDWIKET